MNVPNSPRKPGKRLLASSLIIGLASAPSAVRGADYWLAPPGTPANGSTRTQNSWNQPLPWTTSDVQIIIRDNPKGPSDTNVVIHLRTSGFTNVYSIGQLTLLASPNNASRSLTIQAADADMRPILRYQAPTNGTGLFWGPGWESTMLKLTETLGRFEARNLVLDANWPAWATNRTCASVAYTGGFKIGALKVVANSGTLSNVHVRNFGANGIAPLARYFAVQVECFPLSVYVPSFNYGPNAQPVWFIEDCEVSDFHSIRGGYCSAVMVTTKTNFLAGVYFTNRVAVVRRCQVRGIGNGIAFATANSAGISFHDNVVVGAALGMNTDTATAPTPVRNIDLTNNVFLDVNLMANVGMSGRGADGSGNYLFTNITVSANTTRLRSVPWRQEYGSYEWRATAVGTYTNWLPVSDPSLPVGRLIPGYASGLLIGGADRIWFENNRFTTWPRSQFYEPDPTNTALAIWRPLHKPDYHPVIGQACYHGPHLYAATNWLSSWSMNFNTDTSLPSPPTGTISALATQPGDFVPHGRTMRVKLLPNLEDRLAWVEEVQMGQPEVLTDGRIRVLGRMLFHPSWTYADGSGLSFFPDSLRLRIRSATGSEATLTPVSYSTPNCVFEYQPDPGHGRDELTLFDALVEPDDPLPPGWNVETADTAWTVGEVLRGATVRFERTADVADDRRLYPGLLRIRRGTATGLVSLTLASVTNGVTRPALPEAYPNYDYDLHTNAWSSTNAWGKVLPAANGQWTIGIPDGAREVTVRVKPVSGSTNQDWIEQEAAYFRLVPDANYTVAPPAPWATRGPGGEGLVALWDGPQYKLHELADSWPGGGGMAAGATDPSEADVEEADTEVSPEGVEVADEAAEEPPPEPVDWPVARFSRVQFDDEWFGDPEALSEFAAPAAVGDSASPEQNVASSSPYDTVFLYSYGYAVNTNTLPSIAGYVTYWQSYLSTYYNPGGRWIPPNYADLLHVGSATNSFRCYGVSTANDLAGVWGTQACVALNGASPVWLLPTLSTNLSSEALAIARNGGKIVGWSKNAASVTRPTLWTGSGANWTPNDLGDLETGKAGYAYSVNNNGVAVGKGQVGVNWRAFRKDGGLMTALALPPSQDTFIPAKSTANAMDEAGNAVGATDAVIIRKVGTNIQTRAAIWWIGTNEPTVLGTIFPEGADAYTNPPGRSEALAISTAGLKSTVVGTGWITPTGYPRAWLLSAEKTHPDKDPLLSHMINLSDPHLTYIEECSPSGSCWVLSTAEDVNDQGWIVGNGTRNGNIRGYVLVPQSAVGQ